MQPTSRRRERLYRELKSALARIDQRDLKQWSGTAAKRLPRLLVRRLRNVGSLIKRAGRFAGTEAAALVRAGRDGKLGKHVGDRAAAGIDGAIGVIGGIQSAVSGAGKALFADPRRNAPDLLALALGFYAGSGGLDGDGGIPDADLALGIEWHRSIFTHSIVAGTVIEGAILAIADLADLVCDQLPSDQRDPFWDELVVAKDRIALQLSAGASAGIAYHLAVDATLQEAPYKDLPIGAPIEVHQTIMAANAAAEGIDVANKERTTGRRVVDAASGASRVTWAYATGFLSGLRGGKK